MVFETVRLGQAALLPLLLLQLLACNAFVSLPTRHDWIAPSVHRFHGHTHCSAVPALGSILKTPDSILEMMREVADGLASAQAASLPLVRVDIPLPVTGGTELDDWPGGIRQKYLCLQPLLAETLAKLNFSQTAIEQETFVPTPFGEDDCIGLWSDQGYEIVSFPTPETIPYLQSALQWTDGSSLVAIVNSQIFLDPLSRQESKDFLASAQVAYVLENLNMRGPGALPVRGLVYRIFPQPFLIGRRLDQGGYALIAALDELPPRAELEALFYADSVNRDKNLTFLDRLKKQVPNFGN